MGISREVSSIRGRLHPHYRILNTPVDFERETEILQFAFVKIHVLSSGFYNCKAAFVVCSCIRTRNTPVNAGVESTFNESEKCLAQEHHTMSPPRALTQTSRSGDERNNHEATAAKEERNALERNLTQRNETALKRRFISRKTY